jgi:hypothetical protein
MSLLRPELVPAPLRSRAFLRFGGAVALLAAAVFAAVVAVNLQAWPARRIAFDALLAIGLATFGVTQLARTTNTEQVRRSSVLGMSLNGVIIGAIGAREIVHGHTGWGSFLVALGVMLFTLVIVRRVRRGA